MNTIEPTSRSANPASRRTFVAILVLALVFLLGAAVGVGGSFLYLRGQVRMAFSPEPGKSRLPADRLLDRAEERMIRELELTKEETSAVRQELDITRRELRELRVRFLFSMRGVLRDSVTRAGSRLPEAKRIKLEGITDRWLQSWGVMNEPPQRSGHP
jgi:hypothetical protein